MKKIIYTVIISLLFIFTFQVQNIVTANSEDNQLYEEIDLVYNQNFTVWQYFVYANKVDLYFRLESNLVLENPYLQEPDDIRDNTFFYMYNFETLRQGAFTTTINYPTITNNVLSGIINIPRSNFNYYYEEIAQVDENTFFDDFGLYLDDLSNYFKIYIKVGYETSPNINKKIYESINLVYDDNFMVFDINDLYNRMEITIVIKDDRFIDYKYKDNIYNNSFFVIDYSEAGNENLIYHYITNAVIIGDELHGTVNIVKSSFNYYIDEIVETDEETFYNNFRDAIQYDLYKYFKLYLRIDKEYTYMGFRNYNVTENLKDRGALTSLYDVYIYINTPYNLVSDVTLYFKQDVSAKLQTPLNRGSNSYEILDFRYSMDYYRWRIHLNIALSNTLLEMYDNDADYIIRELMVIYIGVMPGQEYNNGYNDGYNDGIIDGEQFGWNDGYNIGYDQGYDAGFFEGIDDGYSQGYEAGLQTSQGEAYERGYKDGYNKSFIATMDKWLVPAIVLVMFTGGFFAIARKKRDGDI